MRIVKALLKLALVLLVIALLPLLAWWIYNRIDEKPTPAAAQLAEPFPHEVPDTENAWLYLVGLGAAEGGNPIALARRRVDTYNARIANVPAPPADAAEKALFEDPVPMRGPEKPGSSDGLCVSRTTDCIAWAAQHADLLAKLAADNALRQQRFEQLLLMTRFDELYTPDLEEPDVELKDDWVRHNLLAGELASGHDPAAVFDRMLRAARFWQRVDDQAISPLFKGVAGGIQERYWKLQHDALAGPAAAHAARLREASIAILRAQPHDFGPYLKHEFQGFDHTMRGTMRRYSNPLRCFSASESDCVKNFFIAQAYAHQATMNIRAAMSAIERQAYAAEAPKQQAALDEASRDLDTFMPIGDYEKSKRLLTYNGAGQVLAFLSMPALDASMRLHDREGLRRMYLIALDAQIQRIAPAAMERHLAAQPAALRNPYTGEPFDWDAESHEIHFEPLAKKAWKVERLAVSVPAPEAREQRKGSGRAKSQ